MSGVKQNMDVHTYAVGMMLTAAQYYEIKDGLGDFLRKSDGNYWSRSEHYTVDAFREQGVWLYLSRMDTIYRVKVRIEPCRVLAGGDPTALFQADKKQYHAIVEQYIRTLQKSFVLPHYKWACFREGDGKAKNVREANKHSCRQQCRQAAFFAYDKTAQLQMTGRRPEGRLGKRVLRLEAELNRGAMKQHLGKQKSNYQFLKQGVKRAGKVIDWYLKRVYKDNTSPHLRYEDAVACIAGQRWKDKTKERAAYLLRKVSDSQSLDAALQKTMEHFGIKRDAAD